MLTSSFAPASSTELPLPALENQGPESAVVLPFNAHVLPDMWESIPASVSGRPVHCYYAPVDKPDSTAIYVSGLQSSPIKHIQYIDLLRSRNVSVISMALIPEGDHDQYVDVNREAFRQMIFDEGSVLRKYCDPKAPVGLITHSTAGFLALDLLSDPAHTFAPNDLFSSMLHINPFLDTARAAKRNSPIGNALYEAFGKIYGDNPVMSTPIERLVMGKKKADDFYFDTPRHKLILSIRDEARRFLDELERGERSADRIMSVDQLFLIGNDDKKASPSTTKDLVGLLGARSIARDVGHSRAFNDLGLIDAMARHLRSPRTVANAPALQV